MKWTEESLASLPLSGGYRLRGEAMSRIEVFSDAAFAFAVTMLVISLSAIPKNFDELIVAVKGIPAFAASFAVIMVYWISHRRWSRRFGLDDKVSTFLTLSLVFIILVYVYPLKLTMNVTFFAMSGGWLPSEFDITSASEVSGLVILYGFGFCLIGSTNLGLYLRASNQVKDLCLNQMELLLVKEEQLIWSIQAAAGLLSALVAMIFYNSIGHLAGFVFCLLPIVIPLSTMGIRKKKRALQTKPESTPPSS